MDSLLKELHKGNQRPRGVEDSLRQAYQTVFMGTPTKAQQRQVFCDILAQTQIFTAAKTRGISPEDSESKREIGLYLLTVLGMAPSESKDIFDSMEHLVRLFAKNNRSNKNREESKR